MMNVMIINYSGNVGKSTLSKYLFEPRLENCKLYSIESINANDHEKDNIRGNALGIILDDMVHYDNCLIDVGSSNSEVVVSLLASYDEAHEDFDAFVIPVIDKKKVIEDTLTTASALKSMGIPPEKIIVVLNQIDVDTNIDIAFDSLKAADGVLLTFDENLQIPTHDFFGRINGTGLDFLNVINDETNYAKVVKETPKDDTEALNHAVLMRALQRLAKSLKKEFDFVFDNFKVKAGL